MIAPATLYVTSVTQKATGVTVHTASASKADADWHASLKESDAFTAPTPVVAYVHPDEVARLIAEAVAAARRAA